MIHRKRFGKKQSWPLLPASAGRERGNSRNTSVNIANIPAEIRMEVNLSLYLTNQALRHESIGEWLYRSTFS
jgi:hypothetical protein